jgi:hypothetical protein
MHPAAAIHKDCQTVRLKPHALDEELDQAELEAWYLRKGYNRDPEQPEIMQKHLPRHRTA